MCPRAPHFTAAERRAGYVVVVLLWMVSAAAVTAVLH